MYTPDDDFNYLIYSFFLFTAHLRVAFFGGIPTALTQSPVVHARRPRIVASVILLALPALWTVLFGR